MSDGRAVRIPVELDDKKAQKALADLEKSITSMESKLNSSVTKRNAIAEQLTVARQKAEEARTAIAELSAAMKNAADERRAWGSSWTSEQQKTYAQDLKLNLAERRILAHELEKQEGIIADLSDKEKDVTNQVREQTSALEAARNKHEEINMRLTEQATKHWPQIREKAREAMRGANDSFNRSLKSLLRYGFGIRSVFILFRRLRTATIEGVKAFAAYDSETQASINSLKTALGQLKGAWAAAVAPIFNAVAPAIEWFINLITSAANAIATFFAVVQGKSSYKKAVYNLDAVGEAASGAARDVEDLKNQFSGLDEINTWNSDTAGGGGGGGGGGSSGSGLEYVDQAIDMNSRAARLGDFVRENLEGVELLVDAFGFVIGVILMCTGHIALGLGFMLFFGYKGIKDATENWEALKGYLDGPVKEMLNIAGKVAIVIGIILLSIGQIVPGLALIALGAAAEYAGTHTGSTESAGEFFSGLLDDMLSRVKDAALIAGLIAMMTGHYGLAVALLAMGGVSAALNGALEGHTMGGTPTDPLEKILQEAAAAPDLNKWLKENPDFERLYGDNPDVWLRIKQIQEDTAKIADNTDTKTEKPTGKEPIAAAADPALAQAYNDWSKQQAKEADFNRLVAATDKATAEIQRATERTDRGGIEETADIKVGVKKGQWNEDAFEAATLSSGSINKTVNTTAKKGVGWDKEAYEVTTGKTNQNVSLAIGLSKLGWTTLSDFVNQSTGAQVKKGVGVTKDGWSTVAAFVGASTGGAVAKAVGLSKTGWTTLQNYVNASPGGSVSKAVGLYRDGWTTVSGWVNNYIGSGLRVGVTLGAASVAGRYAASGGYITNGELKSWGVQCAGGTTRAHGTARAHGSVIVAGEAGPEVAGHINGRTEILNRSQLASTMYAAITAGMARVLAPAVTVLDRIADLLAGPQLATAGSAVAAGVVVPPQFTRGGSDRLGQIADMLDRLESRLGGGAGGGSYQFTAQLNRRTIFDEIIAEAQLRQAQTGRNPFNF